MAVHAPNTGALTRAPFIPAPPAAITRVLSRFDRDQLAGFIAVAIDLLDVVDGDPEAEEAGLEDSFTSHPADGPGCPIGDGAEDVAWIEWGTRGRHKDDSGAETLARCRDRQALREDDEATGDEADASFPEWDPSFARWASMPIIDGRNTAALGWEDAEDPDNDRCAAGDDGVFAGPTSSPHCYWRAPTKDDAGHEPGNEDDAEDDAADQRPPAYMIDQTRPLFVPASNDWAGA